MFWYVDAKFSLVEDSGTCNLTHPESIKIKDYSTVVNELNFEEDQV